MLVMLVLWSWTNLFPLLSWKMEVVEQLGPTLVKVGALSLSCCQEIMHWTPLITTWIIPNKVRLTRRLLGSKLDWIVPLIRTGKILPWFLDEMPSIYVE